MYLVSLSFYFASCLAAQLLHAVALLAITHCHGVWLLFQPSSLSQHKLKEIQHLLQYNLRKGSRKAGTLWGLLGFGPRIVE